MSILSRTPCALAQDARRTITPSPSTPTLLVRRFVQQHSVCSVAKGSHRSSANRGGVMLQAVKADAQAEVSDAAMLQLISEVSKQVDDAVAATVFANAEAARSIDFRPDSELRSRVLASIQKLSKGLLERDTEVRSPHGYKLSIGIAGRQQVSGGRLGKRTRPAAHLLSAAMVIAENSMRSGPWPQDPLFDRRRLHSRCD